MDRREAMIAAIERDARETAPETGRCPLDPAVLAAMRAVPREAFVPGAGTEAAWINRPLAIGHGQTISQPFIVALMTDLLAIAPGATVLEIGTGSGYQAAVLAELGARTYSVEVIPELAARAREALARAGYGRVHLRCGDGALGWPEAAPFDALIVTAAALAIPEPLVEQLRPGGRMVIPLGAPDGPQELMLIDKARDGAVTRRAVLAVAFVPLTGGRDFPPTGGPA